MHDDTAGGSAWRQYRQQWELRQRQRHRRVLVIGGQSGLGAAAGSGGMLAVMAAVDWLLRRTLGDSLPGAVEREAAVAAGLAGAVSVLSRALRASQDTEAWRTGALGEQETAAALDPLRDQGWCVLHDRRLPSSSANVDHVVIGAAGVWVIETKAWHGRVVLGAERLRRNGQAADAVFDQLWRQSRAITAAAASILGPLGLIARPVLCLPHATLVHGRDASGRLVASPVEVHAPDALVRRLRLAEPILTAAQVEAVVALIDRALPPAVPERPDHDEVARPS